MISQYEFGIWRPAGLSSDLFRIPALSGLSLSRMLRKSLFLATTMEHCTSGAARRGRRSVKLFDFWKQRAHIYISFGLSTLIAFGSPQSNTLSMTLFSCQRLEMEQLESGMLLREVQSRILIAAHLRPDPSQSVLMGRSVLPATGLVWSWYPKSAKTSMMQRSFMQVTNGSLASHGQAMDRILQRALRTGK